MNNIYTVGGMLNSSWTKKFIWWRHISCWWLFDQWDPSTATPMEGVCRPQHPCWKINLIWSHSVRVSWSANELFSRSSCMYVCMYLPNPTATARMWHKASNMDVIMYVRAHVCLSVCLRTCVCVCADTKGKKIPHILKFSNDLKTKFKWRWHDDVCMTSVLH